MVGAGLNRKVNMAHDLRDRPIGIDQARREVRRVRRHEADTLNAVNRGDQLKQHREIDFVAVRQFTFIGVHVLTEKRDFADALLGEALHIAEHIRHGARQLLASGIRHHTVRAELRAAFHDGNKGGGTVLMRLRHVVKLFDARERHVDLRVVAGLALIEHVGQAVKRLGPEDDVHVGSAFNDL